MIRLMSMAALTALLCCFGASTGWTLTSEEERLLGCGCEDARLREYLPFTRRYAASGLVRGSLAEAASESGVPPAAMVEALDALAARIDLERELREGDRFYIRYERSFTAAGDPVGVGRVLWAELDTHARGKVAIHRFQPHQTVGDRFWLSTGESAAPPRIRLPLENVVVSSGFGMRPDPFGQLLIGRVPRPPAAYPIANPRAVGRPPAGSLQPAARLAGGPRAQARPSLYRATSVSGPTPLGLKLGMLPRGAGARSNSSSSMVMHQGIDLVAEQGTPVRAAGDGVVVGAEVKSGYGNWIEIAHEPGAPAPELATVYGHLSAFASGIVPGARVKQGDVIGFVGSTGHSTGPHLHFEIREHGQPVDPMNSAALRREQLRGDELLRFRKEVDRNLRTPDHDGPA